MKSIFIYFLRIQLILFFAGSNTLFSQGDVTARIPTTDLNEAVKTLLDTKGLNIGNYNLGNRPLFGVSNWHVHINDAYFITTEGNISLRINATGRANINLVLFSFEFVATASVTFYGYMGIEPLEQGYKVVFHPVDYRDFEWTGVEWFDRLVQDISEGFVGSLPEISFISYNPLFPSTITQYFTTAVPYYFVHEDGVYLWYDVNELYLGYDTESGTKNYAYRYIEGGPEYIINPTGNITFTHGSNGVNLTDGFTVEEGGIFSTVFDPNLDSEGDNTAVRNMNLAGKNLYVLDTAKPENIGKPKNIPLKYELHQNYPNPFNPSTTIKYDLKNDGKVSLVIYDIIGREVIKLVDWNEEAGYKSVTWDGRNKTGSQISSGVYFYTLRTGDFVKTVKMVFVK